MSLHGEASATSLRSLVLQMECFILARAGVQWHEQLKCAGRLQLPHIRKRTMLRAATTQAPACDDNAVMWSAACVLIKEASFWKSKSLPLVSAQAQCLARRGMKLAKWIGQYCAAAYATSCDVVGLCMGLDIALSLRQLVLLDCPALDLIQQRAGRLIQGSAAQKQRGDAGGSVQLCA